MKTKVQPTSGNPLREHALGFVRISGYMVAVAVILFLCSLPFTVHSVAYWLIAAAAGAVSFPLLWRYWCRPNFFLFAAIMTLLVMSRSVADRVCFPGLSGTSWLLLLQFICLYVVTEFSLVYVFRQRLLESINRHSTVA